jgi:hypothetical protein
MTRSRGTTSPGFENKNGQIVVKGTSKSGTDHNQYIYILRCNHCGTVYGANGSDIWERRCPKPKSVCHAGGGRPGIGLMWEKEIFNKEELLEIVRVVDK